jgi:uncharacterized protein YbjT (DUF2867 family)
MTAPDTPADRPILVTGATGYVAGRLVPLLLASGYSVRTMGRSIEKMAGRAWGDHPNIELVKGDILDRDSLKKAIKGCGTIYYLVHSMISQKEKYRRADIEGARNMACAAVQCRAGGDGHPGPSAHRWRNFHTHSARPHPEKLIIKF